MAMPTSVWADGGVVNAAADFADDFLLFPKPTHLIAIALGMQVREDAVYADWFGNCFGRPPLSAMTA